MNQPPVSIITPCYNGESYLERYFESILKQTYQNMELIFVDDGSTDRTSEIAEKYRGKLEGRGIRYILLKQENRGQASALNQGLKYFTGEYLTWPDSDDVMTPGCIEEKVIYLLKNPDVQMVRSNGIYHNEETQKNRRIANYPVKDKADILEDLLLVKTFGDCGCFMISAELLEQCYPDRDIYESRVGQNWQILVPAASRSLCGYIDKDLYIVYEHGDSHSRKKRTIEQEYERWDLFTDVLHHALDASKTENDKYREMVEENRARQQFYIAVSVRDKKMMKKSIRAVRTFGTTTLKEELLFLKCCLLSPVQHRV